MSQLIVISCYLLLLIGLGLVARAVSRGSAADFFLAERSIGPFFLLMSLFGTTMTAFALVGSTGKSFSNGIGVYGLMASISCIIHPAVFFIIGIKVWSLGKKNGYMTQIQFFRDRLESNHIGIILFPILVGLLIPYLLIGVMASGTIVNVVTSGAFPDSGFLAQYDGGVPPFVGSAVICAVVLFYIFFGGMRGAAWANAFQTIVFMVIAIFAFNIISDKLGGMAKASENVLAHNPTKFKRSVDAQDIATYETKHGAWITAGQINYLRTQLTSQQKDAAHAGFSGPKKGPWIPKSEAIYIKKEGLLAALRSADHAIALAMYKEKRIDVRGKSSKMFQNQLTDPDPEKRWTHRKAEGIYKAKFFEPLEPHGIQLWEFLTYLFIPLSVAMFPHLFQHWLTAKTAKSFRLSVIAHPICIMIVWVPCVLIGAWATSAIIIDGPRAGSFLVSEFINPNAVLPFMILQLTSGVVGGLMAAGILAAIMSSLDSQFLCLSNIFTNDIFLHYNKKKNYTDHQKVMIGRIFVIGVVLVTYLFSLAEPRSVFTLGIWCFSGFGALSPIVFAAIYWPKLTRSGTYAGVLATTACWLIMFWKSDFAAQKDYMIHITGTIEIMPVAVMFAVCVVSMVVVSLATKPPTKETLLKFFPEEKIK